MHKHHSAKKKEKKSTKAVSSGQLQCTFSIHKKTWCPTVHKTIRATEWKPRKNKKEKKRVQNWQRGPSFYKHHTLLTNKKEKGSLGMHLIPVSSYSVSRLTWQHFAIWGFCVFFHCRFIHCVTHRHTHACTCASQHLYKKKKKKKQ